MFNKSLTVGVLAAALSIVVALSSNAAIALTDCGGNNQTPKAISQQLVNSTPEIAAPILIGLRIRNQAQLNALITAQLDRSSPLYHHWLTPTEFETNYSPAQSDVDLLTAFLHNHDIKVVTVSANRLFMQAMCTPSNALALFGAPQRKATNYNLPPNLAQIVQWISGLNNTISMTSQTGGTENSKTPVRAIYSPRDIATLYDFPNANNANLHDPKQILDGSGITLAIVTADGYSQQDLSDFFHKFNINHTGRITDIPIGGEVLQTGKETTLDIEQVTSQIPAANVLVYMASTTRLSMLDLALNQAVCDNTADVISYCWGMPELVEGASAMSITHEIFEEAASQGIAIFASSGDYGAYFQRSWLQKGEIGTWYPSSDPLVTAIGGTTLRIDKSGKINESAWSGSGGGVSSFFDRPVWQCGDGIPTSRHHKNNNQKRVNCDVSLDADPNTGYALRFQGAWTYTGGTSAATPNWAALWCLAEQEIDIRLGDASATLYAIANGSDGSSVFHDVKDGSNGGGLGDGYKAGKGWDYPTGWGTPDGLQLIDWFSKNQFVAAHLVCVPDTH